LADAVLSRAGILPVDLFLVAPLGDAFLLASRLTGPLARECLAAFLLAAFLAVAVRAFVFVAATRVSAFLTEDFLGIPLVDEPNFREDALASALFRADFLAGVFPALVSVARGRVVVDLLAGRGLVDALLLTEALFADRFLPLTFLAETFPGDAFFVDTLFAGAFLAVTFLGPAFELLFAGAFLGLVLLRRAAIFERLGATHTPWAAIKPFFSGSS
jgi:hypothetical protein